MMSTTTTTTAARGTMMSTSAVLFLVVLVCALATFAAAEARTDYPALASSVACTRTQGGAHATTGSSCWASPTIQHLTQTEVECSCSLNSTQPLPTPATPWNNTLSLNASASDHAALIWVTASIAGSTGTDGGEPSAADVTSTAALTLSGHGGPTASPVAWTASLNGSTPKDGIMLAVDKAPDAVQLLASWSGPTDAEDAQDVLSADFGYASCLVQPPVIRMSAPPPPSTNKGDDSEDSIITMLTYPTVSPLDASFAGLARIFQAVSVVDTASKARIASTTVQFPLKNPDLSVALTVPATCKQATYEFVLGAATTTSASQLSEANCTNTVSLDPILLALPPTLPTNVTVRAQNTTHVTASWDAPASVFGCADLTYNVTIEGENSAVLYASNTSSTAFALTLNATDKLESSISYHLLVHACTRGGCGSAVVQRFQVTTVTRAYAMRIVIISVCCTIGVIIAMVFVGCYEHKRRTRTRSLYQPIG